MTNEDGTLWIVFNGEIFNYVELRDELEALRPPVPHPERHRGHRPRLRGVGRRTRSRASTASSPSRCGTRRTRRWCSRATGSASGRSTSREHGGRLCFASEVKAIFAGDPTLPRALDPVGLDRDVHVLDAPLRPRRSSAASTELEPGHVRVISRGRRASDRHVLDAALPGSRPAAASPARSTRPSTQSAQRSSEATRLRMLRADVPVGSYLSGGLDSSLIAALGLPREGRTLLALSRSASTTPNTTRRAFQRMMADAARQRPPRGRRVARATSPRCSRTSCATPSGRCCAPRRRRCSCCRGWCATPASRSSSPAKAPTRCSPATTCSARQGPPLLGAAARAPTCGRGCSSASIRISRDRPVRAARDGAAVLRAGPRTQRAEPGFGHDPRWQSTAALKRLFSPESARRSRGTTSSARLLAHAAGRFHALVALWPRISTSRCGRCSSGYLLSSQGDRMLMAHSVEGRFPFLDVDVVAFANACRRRYKLRGLDEKHVLKRAAAGLVPDEIIRRRNSRTGRRMPAPSRRRIGPTGSRRS